MAKIINKDVLGEIEYAIIEGCAKSKIQGVWEVFRDENPQNTSENDFEVYKKRMWYEIDEGTFIYKPHLMKMVSDELSALEKIIKRRINNNLFGEIY